MTQLFEIILASLTGAAVGLTFGYIQQSAAFRYAKKQQDGKFKSAWGTVPGSFSRIGYLLVALVGAQICCPFLFSSISQWFVSGGLALGYGYIQLRQLLKRHKELAS